MRVKSFGFEVKARITRCRSEVFQSSVSISRAISAGRMAIARL